MVDSPTGSHRMERIVEIYAMQVEQVNVIGAPKLVMLIL
jgi:hypothetical protein